MSNRVSVICSNPTFRESAEPKPRSRPFGHQSLNEPLHRLSHAQDEPMLYSPAQVRTSPYSRSPNPHPGVLTRSPLASPEVKTEAVYLEDHNINASQDQYFVKNPSRPSIICNSTTVPDNRGFDHASVKHAPFRTSPPVPSQASPTHSGVFRDQKVVSPPLELDTRNLTPMGRRGSQSGGQRAKISIVEQTLTRSNQVRVYTYLILVIRPKNNPHFYSQ